MENQPKNGTENNVDISKINELIEKESGFIDLLNMEIKKVIIGQQHMIESLLIDFSLTGTYFLKVYLALLKH